MQPRPLASIFFIFLIFLSTGIQTESVQAQEKNTAVYQLEPVLVYPSIINEYYTNALRHIEYLDELPLSRHDFLLDTLKTTALVDVQRRGPFSIQGDVQIRGASFEQTDILIDGIKVNDPQTGHFNLDIPFFLEDIDKVVIVAGPAASLSGAGRPGGSIHIITKKPEKKQTTAKLVFGENEFSSQTISSTYFFQSIALRTTLTQASAGDYRPNTDFNELGFSQTGSWESSYGPMQFNLGVLDKEFGANCFYSEFFPLQKEYTNTIFSSLSLKSELKDLQINPKVYVRRHKDRFLLDKTNPSFYENFHTNYTSGIKLDLAREFENVQVFLGLDSTQEKIDSTSLGNHTRWRDTLYGSYNNRWYDFVLSLSLTGYFYEHFEDYLAPGINLGYWVNQNTKIRSAFNQSFRTPTFTELYYVSPANMGNENLAPEVSNNYELGLDYTDEYFSLGTTLFQRKGKNLIDWVREESSTVYQIQNVSEVDTSGIELDLKIYPQAINPTLIGWRKLFFSYAYINRSKADNDLVSKYVFDYLRHKFVLGSEQGLFLDITCTLSLDYLERVENTGDFIAYANFDKTIKDYSLFLKIDNLFNRAYNEKANIPMPGRWVFVGIKASW